MIHIFSILNFKIRFLKLQRNFLTLCILNPHYYNILLQQFLKILFHDLKVKVEIIRLCKIHASTIFRIYSVIIMKFFSYKTFITVDSLQGVSFCMKHKFSIVFVDLFHFL